VKEMEKVTLIKNNFLENLKKAVSKKKYSPNDKVVIKVHMGEYGNLTHVRPEIVGAVVVELKKMGAKPFLFDTTTLYRGSRDTPEKYLETAKKNGFTEESIGCPIIISDEGVKVEGKEYFKEIEVAKEIQNADELVVISHFKGHPEAGFGGSIKNLGMGGVTKKTKKIEHTESQPIIIGKCKGCGTCVKLCREGAIQLKNGKAIFNYDKCFGCGVCSEVCPSKALKPREVSFRVLLAEAAYAVLNKFDKEKLLFINVLLDITEKCDCFPNGGEIICPNIGILASDDIVAIDKASFDLVIKKVGKNIFDLNSHIKSEEQIDAAEKFGLGKEEYKLEEFQ
jgi:uncharacterized Fe-S center protein